MNSNDMDMRIKPAGASSPLTDNLRPTSDAAGKGEGESFGALLSGLVDRVDVLQKNADASIQGLVSGEETNIHNVAIKMEEAGVAFDLMMQVRNKLMEAYQEISKMQA